MFAQPPPDESQRSHWYAKLVGLPVQDPVDTLSVLPEDGGPEIEGAAVFDGGATGAGTTAVTFETAMPLPPLFDAVTAARSVDPTSAEATVYDCFVAPLMLAQLEPPESHLCH